MLKKKESEGLQEFECTLGGICRSIKLHMEPNLQYLEEESEW